MNIKNIKALAAAKVYPDSILHGMQHLVEDIPPPDNARCMPYYAYPIPTVPNLCGLISDYSELKIVAEMTEMGFMMYEVTVKITIQDTVVKTFSEPFLDDALAQALLSVKGSSDLKQRMIDEKAKG